MELIKCANKGKGIEAVIETKIKKESEIIVESEMNEEIVEL